MEANRHAHIEQRTRRSATSDVVFTDSRCIVCGDSDCISDQADAGARKEHFDRFRREHKACGERLAANQVRPDPFYAITAL